MAPSPRHIGLWRQPDFLKLCVGQPVSALCSRITRDGLPLVAVLVLAASPGQMGALAASASMPGHTIGVVAASGAARLGARPAA